MTGSARIAKQTTARTAVPSEWAGVPCTERFVAAGHAADPARNSHQLETAV